MFPFSCKNVVMEKYVFFRFPHTYSSALRPTFSPSIQ